MTNTLDPRLEAEMKKVYEHNHDCQHKGIFKIKCTKRETPNHTWFVLQSEQLVSGSTVFVLRRCVVCKVEQAYSYMPDDYGR